MIIPPKVISLLSQYRLKIERAKDEAMHMKTQKKAGYKTEIE